MLAAKILVVILSLAVILIVLLQSGRSAGLTGAITGGTEQMAGRKARGIDAVFSKWTKILGTLFFVICLAIALLASHGY